MSIENISNMLQSITDGNYDAAESSFNTAISDKVASALENVRVRAASEMTQCEMFFKYEDGYRSRGININGETHPANRIPIKHYDDFKKQHPGSITRFRGPRKGTSNTRKEDATHFYVVSVNEEVEQIDEVSGELLGRYIQKARKDIKNRVDKSRELGKLSD